MRLVNTKKNTLPIVFLILVDKGSKRSDVWELTENYFLCIESPWMECQSEALHVTPSYTLRQTWNGSHCFPSLNERNPFQSPAGLPIHAPVWLFCIFLVFFYSFKQLFCNLNQFCDRSLSVEIAKKQRKLAKFMILMSIPLSSVLPAQTHSLRYPQETGPSVNHVCYVALPL